MCVGCVRCVRDCVREATSLINPALFCLLFGLRLQNHTVLMVLPDWRTNPTYPGAEWYEQVWRKHEYGR